MSTLWAMAKVQDQYPLQYPPFSWLQCPDMPFFAQIRSIFDLNYQF